MEEGRLDIEERERMSDPDGEGLTPEQEAMIASLMEGPSFEELVNAGMQELFERVITLENVLLDVITIVSKNADQPATMRDQLQALLVPNDPADAEADMGQRPDGED